jgi:4'-phosphopantetheinyl transferase
MVGMPPSPRESLPVDHCHLWVVPVDQALAGGDELLASWLTDDERAAVGRYHFERHRREHLVSRAVLRAALARYTGADPRSFRFTAGPYGKPELPGCQLAFNVANTESLVVCAVAPVAALGVDVEPATPREEVHILSATAFSPAEAESVRTAADPGAAFLTLWTLKEAYVKAQGSGLSFPTRRFTVVPSGDEASITFDAAVEEDPRAWRLHPVSTVAGYHIAVAARHPRPLTLGVRTGLPDYSS